MSISAEVTPVLANIPGLPEMQVQEPRYIAAAAVVGAVAAYRTIRQNRLLDQQTEADFASPDMEDTVQRVVRKEKRTQGLLTGLAAVTLAGAALHAANFEAEETTLKIDRASVIVDASYRSFPEDIQEGDEQTKRIEAVVNGLNGLDTSGLTIDYYAAGADHQLMGSTNGRDGQQNVVDNFFNYSAENLANRTDSDLSGAIASAMASDSQRILVFSSAIDGESSFQLQGQEEEGARRVSIIQIGEPEASVKFVGAEQEVINDTAAAQAAVGEEDVYDDITSVEQLQETFNEIKSDQFVSNELRKLGIFRTIRDGAGMLLAGSALLSRLPLRRKKRSA